MAAFKLLDLLLNVALKLTELSFRVLFALIGWIARNVMLWLSSRNGRTSAKRGGRKWQKRRR